MCARYTLTARPDLVAELFGIDMPFDLTPRYNVAPTQNVLAARLDPEGKREFVKLRWGLIPSWAHDTKIGYKLINARSETVAEKPSFRSAVKNKRRCLIVADGFFEWKAVGKKKQPYLFRQPDGKPFAFAGLWEHWIDPNDGAIESCTVLTTESNPRVAELHDRMPVIFTTKSEFEQWLTVADVTSMRKPLPEDALTIGPVNDVLNNARNDVPECLQPV